jgi:hypothetical protein
MHTEPFLVPTLLLGIHTTNKNNKTGNLFHLSCFQLIAVPILDYM